MPEGCTSDDPANCAKLRGAYRFNGEAEKGFQVNASSTWNSIGLYTLDLGGRLGLDSNGLYGLEKVGLQLQNSGGIALDNQIVAGIATKDFFVGSFGLGPKPSNFSNYDNPIPAFMWNLRDKRNIPSLSYGYTAGAAYAIPQRYSSLTLGGYDTSRFTQNAHTFPFNKDDSIVLSPGIQKITATNTLLGTRSLLNSAIISVIDSTLPYIWLPKESCDSFAEAFGLIFDENTDLYIVNDTIHEQLLSLKPSVTFSLGNDDNPTNLVSITLPYAALDLQASFPIYQNATNYFPIRRAANETQYTLGRAFLQEAYIIADYERSNFSVHQVSSINSNTGANIVTIHIPSSDNSTDTSGQTNPNPNSTLSKPAIIGISVGAAFLVLVLSILAFFLCRRRRRKEKAPVELDQTFPSSQTYWQPPPQEMSNEQKHEMYQIPAEAHGQKANFELHAKDSRHLLSDDATRVVEAPDGKKGAEQPDGINRVHELSGQDAGARTPRSARADVDRWGVPR